MAQRKPLRLMHSCRFADAIVVEQLQIGQGGRRSEMLFDRSIELPRMLRRIIDEREDVEVLPYFHH